MKAKTAVELGSIMHSITIQIPPILELMAERVAKAQRELGIVDATPERVLNAVVISGMLECHRHYFRRDHDRIMAEGK